MKCDAEKSFKSWGEPDQVDDCTVVFRADAKEACNTFNFAPFYKYMMILGAVEFLAGIVVCFYGIKVYDKLIFAFAFFASAAMVMCISFFFYTTSATPLIIGGVLAVIVGSAVAYVFRAFIVDHGVALLGLVCGGVLGMMISSPIGNQWIMLGVMVAAGGIGCYIGYAYSEFIKVAGLAIIGAGMIVHGIGQYAPGFPSMVIPDAEAAKDLITPAFIGYAAGFIILSVAGYFVQKKMHVVNKGGKNAFDDY